MAKGERRTPRAGAAERLRRMCKPATVFGANRGTPQLQEAPQRQPGATCVVPTIRPQAEAPPAAQADEYFGAQEEPLKRWSDQQTLRLLEAMKAHPPARPFVDSTRDWALIAAHVGDGKTKDYCSKRWRRTKDLHTHAGLLEKIARAKASVAATQQCADEHCPLSSQQEEEDLCAAAVQQWEEEDHAQEEAPSGCKVANRWQLANTEAVAAELVKRAVERVERSSHTPCASRQPHGPKGKHRPSPASDRHQPQIITDPQMEDFMSELDRQKMAEWD